jgi:hypothetical protein
MRYTALLIVAVVACKSNQPEEHYGFITTLGRDTVAVESITRRGNEITSDEADRFPRVRQRHTTITMRDNGEMKRLVMDIHTPSEPENQRDRHVEAEVSEDQVHIAKRDGTGTVSHTFDTNGAVALPHVPQMYSLYELVFRKARHVADKLKLANGDTVSFRQFYIDREFDRFPLHRGRVRLNGNYAEIRHDWLSGTGDAVLDSAGNLLSYNGARTTYDVRVERVANPPDIKPIGDRFAALESQQGGVKSLSVRDTARGKIGNTTFTVDYGRPLARGRSLLGNVIRYNAVWRTGANAATQFSTSSPINLAGLSVPAGMYTLWTVARENGAADLIVNKQTGQWGTEYNSAMNLGRAQLKTETLATPVEEFTISFRDQDPAHGALVLEWGTFRWIASISTSSGK